jgi:hypothetical protein
VAHFAACQLWYTEADFASQRRLRIAFKACLRYKHMRRRFDHVSHLESTVTGTLLVDNVVYTSYCMFVILLICFLCFILLHRRTLQT